MLCKYIKKSLALFSKLRFLSLESLNKKLLFLLTFGENWPNWTRIETILK